MSEFKSLINKYLRCSAATVLLSMLVVPVGATAGGAQFQWKSSDPLILPKPDAKHDTLAVKDPSVVFANGQYHVFMTTADEKGWHIAYTHFSSWKDAINAPVTYLDQTKIGPGYRAAPQIFYFEPQKLWYLVFQGGNPLYSTTANLEDPMSWSEAKPLLNEIPGVVKANIGKGNWLDFWNICDKQKCYLFGADDNGHIYRSETTLAQFPHGYTNTVIAMQDAKRENLFEAAMIYKIDGSDLYLAAVEAMGPKGRYFRSWISDRLDGEWRPLADSLSDAFASDNNVGFQGNRWSLGVSHGELLRSGADQTLSIDTCKPLQFLYQGLPAHTEGIDYLKLPYTLGLLTAEKQPDLCTKQGVASAMAAAKQAHTTSSVVQKIILSAPANAWGAYGGKVTVHKDDTVKGGMALRIAAEKKTNAWETAAAIEIKAPISSGDVILGAFFARAIELPTGKTAARIPVDIGLAKAPYTSIASAKVDATDAWKLYYVSGVAKQDYAAGQLKLSMQLATDTQVVDLGPAFVLNFGQNYDISKLPQNGDVRSQPSGGASANAAPLTTKPAQVQNPAVSQGVSGYEAQLANIRSMLPTKGILIADPSVINVYGSDITAQSVTVPEVAGGKVVRTVLARTPSHPWDDGAISPIKGGVKKGDVLFVAVQVRATDIASDAPYGILSALSVSTAKAPWTAVVNSTKKLPKDRWVWAYASGVANDDYPSGSLNFGMQLGGNVQTLDIGPVFVLNLGAGVNPAVLPNNSDK